MGVNDWKIGNQKRRTRVKTFEEAILTNKWSPYFLFRFRYFLFNTVLKHALHIIEVVLLFHIFNQNKFRILILLTLVLSLISQFWWGALEKYRDQIRDFKDQGLLILMQKYIKVWVRRSFIVSLILGGSIIGGACFYQGEGDTNTQLYLLAIFFRFITDLPMQTYHSGIYAISRIYRPLRSFLVVEMSGFVLVILLWPILNELTLPISVIIGSILNLYVRFYYTKKAYQFVQIDTKKEKDLKYHDNLKAFVLPGLTHMLMKIDVLIILLTFKFTPEFSFSEKINEFLLWILIFPLVQACFDWIKLMYFDLVKIRRTLFETTYKKLSQKIALLSIGMGSLMSLLAISTAIIFFKKDIGYFWVMIPCFMLIRSLLASVQMILFTKKEYAAIAITMILLFTAQVFVGEHFDNSLDKMILFCTLILLNTLVLVLYTRKRKQFDKLDGPLAFIRAVRSKSSKITQLGSFQFDKTNNIEQTLKLEDWLEEKSWIHQKVLHRVQRILKSKLAAAIFFPGQLAWFSTSNRNLNLKEIVSITQGSAKNIQDSKKFNEKILLKLVPMESFDEKRLLGESEILKLFLESIDEGHIIDLSESIKRDFSFNVNDQMILRKVQHYALSLTYLNKKIIQADCLLENNKIRKIFIYPNSSKGKRKWQKILLEQNYLRSYYY